MGQLEKFRRLSTEVLASGGTNPPFVGFFSATAGSEYPFGKVQV